MEGDFPEDRLNSWMGGCSKCEKSRAKLPEATASPRTRSKLLTFLNFRFPNPRVWKWGEKKIYYTFPALSCVGESSCTCSGKFLRGCEAFLLQSAWSTSCLSGCSVLAGSSRHTDHFAQSLYSAVFQSKSKGKRLWNQRGFIWNREKN